MCKKELWTHSRSWPSKEGTASKVCPKKVRTEVLLGKGSSRCYNATRTAFEPDNHQQSPLSHLSLCLLSVQKHDPGRTRLLHLQQSVCVTATRQSAGALLASGHATEMGKTAYSKLKSPDVFRPPCVR